MGGIYWIYCMVGHLKSPNPFPTLPRALRGCARRPQRHLRRARSSHSVFGPGPHSGTFDRSTKARLKYFSTYGFSCLFSADTQPAHNA